MCGQHFSRNGSQGFKKNELKPWKSQCWVIPPHQSSVFVAAMEQVLDVYKRPYDPSYPVSYAEISGMAFSMEPVVAAMPRKTNVIGGAAISWLSVLMANCINR